MVHGHEIIKGVMYHPDGTGNSQRVEIVSFNSSPSRILNLLFQTSTDTALVFCRWQNQISHSQVGPTSIPDIVMEGKIGLAVTLNEIIVSGINVRIIIIVIEDITTISLIKKNQNLMV